MLRATLASRDQLKAGLSATGQAQADEGTPTVSELAEKIKALKAASSVEGTPQRVRQKHSSGEEPGTASIRRRQEASHASEAAIQPGEAAPVAGESSPPEAPTQANPEGATAPATPSGDAGTVQNSSIKPETTFKERIATERQRNGQGPDLP